MKMQTFAAAMLTLASLASPAMAAPEDALSQCLVAKTTAADRVALIQWVFAGMARSEAARDMASVSEAQRVAAMRKAGALVERLMTVDCRTETIAQMKSDPAAIENAFGTLGKRAMDELIRDPQVEGTFTGIIQYIDMNKFVSMLVESGSLSDRKK